VEENVGLKEGPGCRIILKAKESIFMKQVLRNIIGIPFVLAAVFFSCLAFAESHFPQVEKIVRDTLDEKMKLTGKLDLYDSGLNKVRNLEYTNLREEIAQEGSLYLAIIDFRDAETGELVEVKAVVEDKEGVLGFKSQEILKVNPNPFLSPDQAAKVYSDEEVKDVMKKYLDQKSVFSGTFDIFDETAQKLRHLKFVNLKEEVRRFGILAIGTAQYEDAETQEKSDLDVTVENVLGVLNVQAVRIKNVQVSAS
jgi:hypothetical protein